MPETNGSNRPAMTYGAHIERRSVLGEIVNENASEFDAVDVATEPGLVAIRSSRQVSPFDRRAARAWLSAADARALAALLIAAAEIVEDCVGGTPE